MNRKQRRAFEREAKKQGGAALLAAQEQSRQGLDRAIQAWASLSGATKTPAPIVRSVILTNRNGERVLCTASLTIDPAPPDSGRPFILLVNPERGGDVPAMIQAAGHAPEDVEVVKTWQVPKRGQPVFIPRDDLTPEQQAMIGGRE